MSGILIISLALSLFLFYCACRIEHRRIAEDTRREVMSSVMDVHNNLLNNLVYFRVCAEGDGKIEKSDLVQMDLVICRTKVRLEEIANAELSETRDLGGIRVLSQQKIAYSGKS